MEKLIFVYNKFLKFKKYLSHLGVFGKQFLFPKTCKNEGQRKCE